MTHAAGTELIVLGLPYLVVRLFLRLLLASSLSLLHRLARYSNVGRMPVCKTQQREHVVFRFLLDSSQSAMEYNSNADASTARLQAVQCLRAASLAALCRLCTSRRLSRPATAV
jgi:hypothetical protein